MAGTRWRRWNAAIHRDLGYLCAGFTIVYAVSGVAVNHTADWNPNYSTAQRTVALDGGVVSGDPSSADFARRCWNAWTWRGRRVGRSVPTRRRSRSSWRTGATVTVDLAAGTAALEVVRDRPGLRQANFLHLNHAKKLWTWMADLYAVALALLAVTGLFVLRGRNGITGRGAWLTAAGVAVPVLFLLLYF